MTGIAVFSLAATPQLAVLVMGLYVVALAASIIEIRPRQLLSAAPQSPLALMRMSPQAREAVERVRRRGSYTPPGLMLTDIGLIAMSPGRDGATVMRRTRAVSFDDDGVRPYITLDVSPSDADRNSIIRFEIIDQNGDSQFVHEMKTYLRDGEMNILADHHLPLIGNKKLAGAGDWDLRVSVDGAVIGLLGFTTTPSLRERERLLTRDTDGAIRRLTEQEPAEAEDDNPASLEELLRGSKSQGEGR
jgi:hypothetical protein